MYTSSDTRLEWPGEGHYSSPTQINAGGAKRGRYSSHLLGRPAALGQMRHPPGNPK